LLWLFDAPHDTGGESQAALITLTPSYVLLLKVFDAVTTAGVADLAMQVLLPVGKCSY
jgi:hypothetical protein